MSLETAEPNGAAAPADDPEREAREWLRTVYQGDRVRQLSVRSIVTGMLIGAVMSVSNLYIGIKTGWNLGVTVTACIIAFAVFKTLERIVPAWRRDPFSILENYTMSSAASAAGMMSAAGLISAIPALYLTEKIELSMLQMATWLTAVSLLGVFMAIPLKRQLINIEKLPFPSGIATAETLRSMHTTGRNAMQKAKALFCAMGIGAIVAIWREGVGEIGEWYARSGFKETAGKIKAWAIPDSFPVAPGELAAGWHKQLGIGIEGTMLLLGSGAIMGMRICCSLLVGAIFYFGILGNWLISQGIATQGKYTEIVQWTLWPATAMLVANGLLGFALRWRTILRSFGSLAKAFKPASGEVDLLRAVEVPFSWFIVGTTASGAACVFLGNLYFGITWWMGILAVLLAFFLSVVAARATGETDMTPIGAMGKIAQLTYAGITPRTASPTEFTQTNLMTAMVTAGAACHSADLLTDLKSGYLLGGNPRKQLISQLFGILAGAIVCVPVYMVIVPNAKIGQDDVPMPSAKVWEGVAKMLKPGGDGLPEHALAAIIIGASLGVVLTLAEEFTPRRYHAWIPSPTGLGIAGVIPCPSSISMFLGAVIAFFVRRWRADIDEKYTVPVSSGLIAGDSLAAVSIKLIVGVPAIIEGLSKPTP